MKTSIKKENKTKTVEGITDCKSDFIEGINKMDKTFSYLVNIKWKNLGMKKGLQKYRPDYSNYKKI